MCLWVGALSLYWVRYWVFLLYVWLGCSDAQSFLFLVAADAQAGVAARGIDTLLVLLCTPLFFGTLVRV